jgi:hypothetical protein
MGLSLLRIRFRHCIGPAEYMRMPAPNAKHVLIGGEALDAGRLQTGAAEEEFELVEEGGDDN